MPAVPPNDWERLTPVTLSGEQPIPQFVGDGASPGPLFLQPIDHFTLRFSACEPVQKGRVFGDPISGETGFGRSRRLDDVSNLESKLLSEFEIAFVVARDRHDGAGSIADQNIVRDPDRDLFLVHRVNGVST